jgi:hypothetical protein
MTPEMIAVVGIIVYCLGVGIGLLALMQYLGPRSPKGGRE